VLAAASFIAGAIRRRGPGRCKTRSRSLARPFGDASGPAPPDRSRGQLQAATRQAHSKPQSHTPNSSFNSLLQRCQGSRKLPRFYR